MVERENFPSRMSLSLSFFAPNEASSARQKHRRRRSLSTPSLAFVSIAEKRQRGVCLSSKISARVCSNSTDGKIQSPKALRSVSVLCFSRDRKTHEKRRPRVLALSRRSRNARVSLSVAYSRVKEREKRSKICAEIASFFPSFLYFSN